MVIPQHVAIILDGNGRWAKSKGMPRNYGHSRGAKNLEVICEDAWNMGIKYLTVYLFSTENWKRSKEEVDGLMRLFRSYTKTCIKTAQKNNMKVRVLGRSHSSGSGSSGEPEKAGGVLEGQHRTEFPDRHQLRQPGRDHESGPPSGSGCEGRKAGR